jgi:hypothetical protein
LPFVFGGGSSRVDFVIVPFWVGAIALAASGLFAPQGRTFTGILYFIAGLAIVYGLLSMFSFPLKLAVLGTCPAPPAACTNGLPRPLTDGENTGIGVAAALGIAALLLGFYGLMTLYRHPAPEPVTPPVRRIPPMAAPKPAAPPSKADPEPEPELPAHAEESLPELPPHESGTPTT